MRQYERKVTFFEENFRLNFLFYTTGILILYIKEDID